MRFWDSRAAISGVVVAAALVTGPSCATTFHQGEVRPEAESAILWAGSDNFAGYAVIYGIDGKGVEGIGLSNARYVLPPGLHVVVVRLVLDANYENLFRHMAPVYVGRWVTSPPLSACFVGKAKGHYVVQPQLYPDRTFRPIVVTRKFNRVSGVGQPLGPVEHRAGEVVDRESEVSVDCSQARLYPPGQTVPPPTAGGLPAKAPSVP
jgi:hypothetical protein